MPTPRSPYFTIARVSIEDEDDLWAIYLGKQGLSRLFVIRPERVAGAWGA